MIRTILGIDYGLKRVGLAIGNTLTNHAEPLSIIARQTDQQVIKALSQLIKEWQISEIAIGIPRQPDGAPHEMTTACEEFAKQLKNAFQLPIHPTDERYSSATLTKRTKCLANGEIRHVAQDDAAATVILQQHLEQGNA